MTNNGSITLSWEGNDPDEGDSLTYTIYFDEVDGLQDPIEEDSIRNRIRSKCRKWNYLLLESKNI